MDRHTDTMLDMRHLQRAARTLAALPVDAFTKPAEVRSCWPEMIRGNYIEVDGTRRAGICRPTSQQIDEMDRILLCLADLSLSARRLLWARACQIRWRKLEMITGRSRSSLHRDVQHAMVQLQKIWQQQKNHLDK
ncbi:MAG: DUF6362 family protein [Alphaproteobacteria bacterium]